MNKKTSTLAVITVLMTGSAYAEDWNTRIGLIKAGAKIAIAGPVVLPVMAIQNAVQGKPIESATNLLIAPITPILGIGVAGVGVLCNLSVNDTNTQTALMQPVISTRPKSEALDPATYKKQPLKIKHKSELTPLIE
jgi:hypothetical protein